MASTHQSDGRSDGRSDGTFDEAAKTARRTIDDYAAAGRDAGASAIHDVAEAAHGFADQMEERQPDLARYARRAADGVDQVSEAIRSRSVGELLREELHAGLC